VYIIDWNSNDENRSYKFPCTFPDGTGRFILSRDGIYIREFCAKIWDVVRQDPSICFPKEFFFSFGGTIVEPRNVDPSKTVDDYDYLRKNFRLVADYRKYVL
jgi:hypothetical protein